MTDSTENICPDCAAESLEQVETPPEFRPLISKRVIIIAARLVILAALIVTFFSMFTSSSEPEIGDIIGFGGYDWRVLDARDGKILLLSEYKIRTRAYHSGGSVTWEDSEIRLYLNQVFLNNLNLTDVERTRVARTYIENNDNPWFGTSGGNNTLDYVFLLSLEEVVRYFGDSGQLENRPHIKSCHIRDEYDEGRAATHLDGSNTMLWWLRSPGVSGASAAFVGNDQGISVLGIFVGNTQGGIRPALWLYSKS